MIRTVSPLFQALLGTLFTWFLTAVGAGVVFLVPTNLPVDKQQKLLDASLGFAAGVMTAASFWSLLDPAIEHATQSGIYGEDGAWSFVPVAVGFIIGALFVAVAERWLPDADATALAMETHNHKDPGETKRAKFEQDRKRTWRRILLLVAAITIHNFPEGMAVGVGFGAIGKTPSATFESAKSLAIGIGLQNFPEGLAVSLPLMRLGFSPLKSFWFGQLSGMVEPIAGLLGAGMVSFAEPVLPYALAFAAGAMIFVVVDDLVPEAHAHGNGRLSSYGVIVGFVVMMVMDVALG